MTKKSAWIPIISLLISCKPMGDNTQLKSLEALSGLDDIPTCGSRPALSPASMKPFLSGTKVSSKNRKAWSDVLSALPGIIKSEALAGHIQLGSESGASSCSKGTENLSLPNDVKKQPGCFAGGSDLALLFGLKDETSIRTHGVRLISLAYLNMQARSYLVKGVTSNTMLFKQSAHVAAAFLRDLEALTKSGKISKERLELFKINVIASMPLYSSLITANTIESLACGGVKRTKSYFPQTTQAYLNGVEGQSLKEFLSVSRQAGFGLSGDMIDIAYGGTGEQKVPTEWTYPTQTAEEALGPTSYNAKVNPDSPDNFYPSADSYPNMSLQVGNLTIPDPRGGEKSDPNAIAEEARRLGWPAADIERAQKLAESNNGGLETLERASFFENAAKDNRTVEQSYYEKVEKYQAKAQDLRNSWFPPGSGERYAKTWDKFAENAQAQGELAQARGRVNDERGLSTRRGYPADLYQSYNLFYQPLVRSLNGKNP